MNRSSFLKTILVAPFAAKATAIPGSQLEAPRGDPEVVGYLRKDEWTMGNGQSPDCYGAKPDDGWWTKTIGHRPTCARAKAIEALGGKVVWEHENTSEERRRFENPRGNFDPS